MSFLSLPGACKLDGLQAGLGLGMSETHPLQNRLHFAIRSQVKASCRGASNHQCDMVGRASAGAESLPETGFHSCPIPYASQLARDLNPEDDQSRTASR